MTTDRRHRAVRWLAIVLLGLALTGCRPGFGSLTQDDHRNVEENLITVGFSQVGAESDWRTANTDSMKDAFSLENGYNLMFDDAQQKQNRQITAIRNYIQQAVDYIVLAPVMETGWETVLTEAKEAGIPVIVVDRMVDVEDEDLYTAWVGSDFELEGKAAAAWLEAYVRQSGISAEDVHIADIQGTLGASAQIGRSEAIAEAAARNGWDLAAVGPGDYTRAKSREVMAAWLQEKDYINVVYCENDNEAYGAIEALEQAGRRIGSDLAGGDVLVMSFDATHTGLRFVLDGKISLNTECNPMHGPRVREIIDALERGEDVKKRTYVREEIFASDDTVSSVVVDGQSYPVIRVTQELIDGRPY